jgi:hypothetical protein
MAKNTSLLTKNTTFHIDTRKWQKWENAGQIPFPVAKNLTLFGKKQLDIEGNKTAAIGGHMVYGMACRR